MNYVYGTDAGETLGKYDGVTSGDDFLFGLGGDDALHALEGDDHLKGGGGADNLHGGYGADTAHYDDSDVGVIINLGVDFDGAAYLGTAQGDVFYYVENLSGSQHDD